MSLSIYLYGAGDFSQIIAEIVLDRGGDVRGIFDDSPQGRRHPYGEVLPGLSIAGAAAFASLDAPLVFSLGDNARRDELARALPAEVEFATAVHPSVLLSASAQVGRGTVILQGSVVQAGTRLGEHVLINTAASIDHHNLIGDCVHVSPNVTLCGHVEIGEGSHVGAGATILPGLKVGKWCTVGAGAVVISDVPDYAVVVGNPARIIRRTQPPSS